MRRSVVIDESGVILASGPHPDDLQPTDASAPTYLGYVPEEGQQVHTVEFPDVGADEILRIHSTHRVRVHGGEARLETKA